MKLLDTYREGKRLIAIKEELKRYKELIDFYNDKIKYSDSIPSWELEIYIGNVLHYTEEYNKAKEELLK